MFGASETLVSAVGPDVGGVSRKPQPGQKAASAGAVAEH